MNEKTKSIPTPKTPTERKASKTTHTKTIVTKKTPTKTTTLPTPPSRKQKQPQQQNKSYLLVVVAIVIIGLLLWTQKEKLLNKAETNTTENLTINQGDDTLFVGKDIITQGIISTGKNTKAKYTHLIQSPYGELGLRSLGVNLNEFSGDVQIEGKVIDFINNLYVVQVTKITPSTDKTTSTNDPIVYFSQPGLLIKNLNKE